MAWKKVPKEEYDQFVKGYEKPLKADYNQICEPPLITQNDFTLGGWPESVVARVVVHSAWDKKRSDEYFLRG